MRHLVHYIVMMNINRGSVGGSVIQVYLVLQLSIFVGLITNSKLSVIIAVSYG